MINNKKPEDLREVVVRLSPQEIEVVLDVLSVEHQGLELGVNKNEDALQYGKILEGLQRKLQVA